MQNKLEHTLEALLACNLTVQEVFKVSIPTGNNLQGITTKRNYLGILVPLKGQALYIIDKKKYHLEPGSILFSGGGISLDKFVLGNHPWTYALIHYQAAGSALAVNYLNQLVTTFAVLHPYHTSLLNCLNTLYLTKKQDDSKAKIKIKTAFYHFIEMMMATAQISSSESAMVFQEILEYIHTNYQNRITIETLSTLFHMDAKHFSYLFQKEMGISPKRYILGYQVEAAKRLLLEEEHPVHLVAQMIGFEDPFYFSRVFKKITGVSPSEFRKSFGKSPY